MKIYAVLLKLAVAGALLTPAFAQSTVNVGMNVPFAFHVGAQSLPAGQYTFKAIGGSGLLIVQDASGKHCAMAVTSRPAAERGPDDGELLFRVNGTDRHLAGVWASASAGREVSMPAAERKAAGIQTTSLLALHTNRSR